MPRVVHCRGFLNVLSQNNPPPITPKNQFARRRLPLNELTEFGNQNETVRNDKLQVV